MVNLKKYRRGADFRLAVHLICATSLMALAGCALTTGSRAMLRDDMIRIDVLEPRDRHTAIAPFPVSVGLVFVKGELDAAGTGRLLDDQGKTVAFESEVTGWWDAEHTQVKWLLLHFRADPKRTYYFDRLRKSRPRRRPPIAVETADAIEVNAGRLQARISKRSARPFEALSLDGKLMVTGESSAHTLVIDAVGRRIPGEITQWQAELEDVTPVRAIVKVRGFYTYGDNCPMARIDLRYHFHRDETFVRVYHTITWMIRSPTIGIREMSLDLGTNMASGGQAQIGLNDGDEPLTYDAGSTILAHQDEAEYFTIYSNDNAVREGRQLGGWVQHQAADGSAVSVTLRHAWETYPTSFELSAGRISTRFWPRRGARMGFMPRDIMGDRIYFHPTWKRYPFSKEAGHFVNNYEKSRGFAYTAEGAAWTHELMIGLHDDQTARTAAQLNEVTQRPLVLRQDPTSAMRVPFMGMQLTPVQAAKHADMERAVDWLGRLSMARWINENNYGLLRFGMVRWAKHGDYTYYRWMDNTQYDQQMIPWMLFMRGGDRRFYEDGEIVGRYCMDMNVNHYNTRDSHTGYMATCGGALPFPNFAFMPWNLKGMKVHFLAYYWHMTGYRRAKDVLDEVIAGTKAFTREYVDKVGSERLAGGREMYNMNRFWALAYEETHDPEIAEFARQSREQTIGREYNAEKNTWGGPKVYLYNGLLAQAEVFKDPELEEVMTSHLQRSMLGLPGNGIIPATDVIACSWAQQQTNDDRFAAIAWDSARGLADMIPPIDLATDDVPFYPYTYLGNSILRLHMLPILVGMEAGDRMGYTDQTPQHYADLMFFLDPPGKDQKKHTGTAYVRSSGGGDVEVRVVVRSRSATEVTVKASGDGDREIVVAKAAANARFAETPIVLPGVGSNETVTLTIESDAQTSFMVLGDAQIVYPAAEALRHANEPIAGGQSFTPQRMFTRSLGGPVAYNNRQKRAWAVRDAATGALIYRASQFTTTEASPPVDAGREIVFTVRGCRATGEWQLRGVAPYVSATREQWFNPDE